jgi:hypothetical protein
MHVGPGHAPELRERVRSREPFSSTGPADFFPRSRRAAQRLSRECHPGCRGPFTAHWHCLLDTHRDLAQRVLDLVADRCGLDRTAYVEAHDHPTYTPESRPDFLLRGADYDVLCEQKLDAELGPEQLERYCGLAAVGRGGRTTYVILVAKSPLAVPAALNGLAAYRRPHPATPAGSSRDHFLWQDLYPFVQATPGRLAQDFVAYMDDLGLEPKWSWGAMGDPFTDT